MGYYTTFTLSIIEGSETKELIEKFRADFEGAHWAIDDNGFPNEACKWYSFENDLLQFSKLHPTIIFCLAGEGEESDDLWRLYVKDGQHQRCQAQIVYPEFDRGKLLADIRDVKINSVLK